MLTDKLPPHYARQLVTAGTDTVVALVAALGMPVRHRHQMSLVCSGTACCSATPITLLRDAQPPLLAAPMQEPNRARTSGFRGISYETFR